LAIRYSIISLALGRGICTRDCKISGFAILCENYLCINTEEASS